VLTWSRYAALGDSLTAGRGDTGPDGRPIGWARRLADLLTARTGIRCGLTNLAADGAGVSAVLGQQLPSLAGIRPDLVSVTVGMNDIRAPDFTRDSFAVGLRKLLDGVAATGATVLTCTLPDIATVIRLPADLVDLAHQRMWQASEAIREQAAQHGAVCLDIWTMPDAGNPDLFTPDRIHPNASGHRRIAAAFADLLLPA
jgi:lysophospholipase L1-like esterase